MKSSLLSFVIVLGIVVFSGMQSSAETKESAPEDAIRAADQEWACVFAAKDLEHSVAFCADDTAVLAPNAPIATGKPAINQLFSGFFALPGFSIEWHPVKVEVARSGEMAYSASPAS